MSLDELDPITETYILEVKPDVKGNFSMRGRNYSVNCVKRPSNGDENLIYDMINGCVIRLDFAYLQRDKKTKKVVAKVFSGFKDTFYSFE